MGAKKLNFADNQLVVLKEKETTMSPRDKSTVLEGSASIREAGPTITQTSEVVAGGKELNLRELAGFNSNKTEGRGAEICKGQSSGGRSRKRSSC